MTFRWSDTPVALRTWLPRVAAAVVGWYGLSLWWNDVHRWPGAREETPAGARAAFDKMAACNGHFPKVAFDDLRWWTVDTIPERIASHPTLSIVGGIYLPGHGIRRPAIAIVRPVTPTVVEHEALHAIVGLPSVGNDVHPPIFDVCAPGGTNRSIHL